MQHLTLKIYMSNV